MWRCVRGSHAAFGGDGRQGAGDAVGGAGASGAAQGLVDAAEDDHLGSFGVDGGVKKPAVGGLVCEFDSY